MDLIKMSGSAAILIMVIVIIRALAKNRLPKKTFLALWGVALCRLLIPFTFPAPFSFQTLTGRLCEFAAGTPAAIFSGEANPLEISAALLRADYIIIPVSDTIDTAFLLILAWLGGAIACFLFFVTAHLHCRREYNTSLPANSAIVTGWKQEHPLKRDVQIRQSDKILAPLTYGILKPVVLLPKSMDLENTAELQYVLAHEYTHIRCFDVLTKCIMALAVTVHWFNPLAWLMYVLANRDIEHSCDEAVVRFFGETAKSSYALALLEMEEKRSRLTPLCNNFSKNAIEERIRSIMKLKKPSLTGIIAGGILVTVTACIFATSAASNNSTVTITGDFISGTIDSVNYIYSVDDGQTWVTGDEYLKEYPASDIAWGIYEVNYEEYEARLEQENIAIAMEESIRPYVGFGVSYARDSGMLIYEEQPVREIFDSETGMLITISIGTGFSGAVTPEGAIDLTAVYENGLLTGLKKSTPAEFDLRTQERLKNK